jgi:protease-4
MLGRGERIKASPEVVLSGQIWIGSEAVRIGIADKLGTETDALNKAAELAKVKNYKTANLRELLSATDPTYSFFMKSPDGATLPYPTKAGMYMLFIPQLPVKK